MAVWHRVETSIKNHSRSEESAGWRDAEEVHDESSRKAGAVERRAHCERLNSIRDPFVERRRACDGN
jgi:hypothetical protein